MTRDAHEAKLRKPNAFGPIGSVPLDGIDILFTGAKHGGDTAPNRSRSIKINNTVTLLTGESTNGIDYEPTITSTSSTAGHASAFQARQIFSGTGTYDAARGFTCVFDVEAGATVTDAHGFRYFDPSNAGTITDNVGFWCETLAEGTSKNAIYTEVPNTHRFGGNLNLHRRGASTSAATITGLKGRGSESAVTQAQTNDLSLQLQAQAYDNEATPVNRQIANIRSVVVTAPTSSSSPGQWEFQTTPTGSTTLVTCMTMDNQGAITCDSTTGAFSPNVLTTVERDALTPVAGMVCYNETTSKLNVYTGAAWEAVTSA